MTANDPGLDFGPLLRLLGYSLRRTQLAVFQSFGATFAEVDLRPAQYSVLVIVDRNPGLSQSQVAEALDIKRANFVALVDSLEQRELVRRQPSPTDRRSHTLVLTDQGKALADQATGQIERHEQRFAEVMGGDNRDRLLELLHLLGDALVK